MLEDIGCFLCYGTVPSENLPFSRRYFTEKVDSAGKNPMDKEHTYWGARKFWRLLREWQTEKAWSSDGEPPISGL